MKKTLATLAFAALTTGALAQAPAFPGAEGHGRYTTGGRGGKIVHVTNLNDKGAGSFRQAVSGNDKKIVVFDVSGIIELASDVNIGGNTTILGQTAPGEGITLRYYTVQFSSGNVVMRFIRSRRGEEKDVNDGADAIWTRQKTGIMLDHCSFSWSIDEVASFYDNNNFTMQWCTIAESLVNPGHSKGAHGYGGIWGGKLASFHHNLIAHVANRSPRFNGARYNWSGYTSNKLYTQYKWQNTLQAENVDFRNCVVYNCGNGCYGGPGGGQINIVNNYYKTGPAGTTSRITNASLADSGNSGSDQTFWGMSSRYFIEGNQVNSLTGNDWSRVIADDGTPMKNGSYYTKDPKHYYGSDVTYETINGVDHVKMQLDAPAPTDEVTTHKAATAFEKVLGYAGASLSRDGVDTRYMSEARQGTATYKGSVTKTGGRLDKVADQGAYTLTADKHPAGFDTDNDGIPDAWEKANGLDPNNALDAVLYSLDPLKYYSNLEVYANSLVQDIMLNGNADAEQTPEEYYPAYTKEDGTRVAAINYKEPEQNESQDVSYVLAQDTYVSGTTDMLFASDIVVSNEKGKGYAAGKENGIKYSAGVQYTIKLPENVYINRATFSGYDNYADVDAYLSEVAGQDYEPTTYVFPQKQGDAYKVVSNEVVLPAPVGGSLTFTPAGKQVVLAITLEGTKGAPSAISSPATLSATTTYYNMQGMRLGAQPCRGAYIRVDRMSDGTTKSRKVVRP